MLQHYSSLVCHLKRSVCLSLILSAGKYFAQFDLSEKCKWKKKKKNKINLLHTGRATFKIPENDKIYHHWNTLAKLLHSFVKMVPVGKIHLYMNCILKPIASNNVLGKWHRGYSHFLQNIPLPILYIVTICFPKDVLERIQLDKVYPKCRSLVCMKYF